MIERLRKEVQDFSEKDWAQLINDFFVLKQGLEEISDKQQTPEEYIAVLFHFGHFYMKNRISLIKCRNIRESLIGMMTPQEAIEMKTKTFQ